MFPRSFRPLPLAVLAVLLTPGAARAQFPFESVGIRALGMAGAFVAVADDATAVYWNPAGLPNGSPAGMTVEWNRFQTGNRTAPPVPGPADGYGTLVSLGTWPVGISYGRLRSTWLASGPPASPLGAQQLDVFQIGGTLVQTVAPGVVIGSTLKYLRGSFATGPVDALTVEDALSQGSSLEGPGANKFDMDVGVMADMRYVRLGLTSRNLLEPQFTDTAGNTITVSRQTRAGLAVLPGDGLTLAIDVDLETVDLRDGLRQMIALGGEGRLGARLALRGGVRWNLKQDHQEIAAVGLGVQIRQRLWLDGYYTQGRRDEDRGFGIGLRAGY
ncbi:MAG TPA: conjugal transfer protein TraF [Vicinamibacterales bacterium]|nr:conjugal transfer protein TraF [Vicinamibacterales bacterium]